MATITEIKAEQLRRPDTPECKTKELKDQVVSLLDAIRTGQMPPAKFPMVTRELFQAYIDMEEEMVARAEVDALAREEQQAALEMGL